jgi:hypothetical protein
MRKTSRIVRLKLHNVECLLQEMYVSEGYREHPHERDRVEKASDSLPLLQRVIKSNIVAPQCTFKYLQSAKSPAEALVDALADFNF